MRGAGVHTEILPAGQELSFQAEGKKHVRGTPKPGSALSHREAGEGGTGHWGAPLRCPQSPSALGRWGISPSPPTGCSQQSPAWISQCSPSSSLPGDPPAPPSPQDHTPPSSPGPEGLSCPPSSLNWEGTTSSESPTLLQQQRGPAKPVGVAEGHGEGAFTSTEGCPSSQLLLGGPKTLESRERCPQPAKAR